MIALLDGRGTLEVRCYTGSRHSQVTLAIRSQCLTVFNTSIRVTDLIASVVGEVAMVLSTPALDAGFVRGHRLEAADQARFEFPQDTDSNGGKKELRKMWGMTSDSAISYHGLACHCCRNDLDDEITSNLLSFLANRFNLSTSAWFPRTSHDS